MNNTSVTENTTKRANETKDTSRMVLIPAGPFQMGSASGGEFEGPVREVYLDAFELDITPVTNNQFRAFTEQTQYRTTAERNGCAWGFDGKEFRPIEGLSWLKYEEGRELHPVVLVSWDDAVAYATWAEKRLPTEAEWEKAARGKALNTLYPWGVAEPNGIQCNFARQPDEVPPTTEVRKFSPNDYGLFDMVGNVWQWCSDWYAENYYATGPAKYPTGPAGGTLRVRRGGSWNVIQPFRLRCANRGAVEPSMAVPNLGFRCAKS